MQTKNLSLIYFSATKTTERTVRAIAEGMELPVLYSHNLADDLKIEFPAFGPNDVLLVASPVYGGRLPTDVAEKLKTLQSNRAEAVPVVVFGNRDYDDALLELSDLLTASGFHLAAAAACIGQHSVFPKVGFSRPDKTDMLRLRDFGEKCAAIIRNESNTPLQIKGHRPYKKYSSIPLHPKGDDTACTKCGTCANLCPKGAIDIGTPWKTDPDRCISCGRCIAVCPNGIRRYKGFKYKAIGKIFYMAFSERKDPEFFF